jgi:hypothetical protein
MLYTIDDGTTLGMGIPVGMLRAIDVSRIAMELKGSAVVNYGGGSITVGGRVAYLSAVNNFFGGYSTVDVTDPANMTNLGATPEDDLTNAHRDPVLAVNGSGVGLIVPTGLGGNSVLVYDVSNPFETNTVIAAFNLPSTGASVTIAGGLGYVANNASGLQVVNYLSPDNAGVAPTLSIAAPPGQVPEGTVIPIDVTVDDDVQVRNVELLVNGNVVANRLSFPWQLSAVAPQIEGESGSVTVQARATDTGGNVALSNLVTIQVTRDGSPPSSFSPPQATARRQSQ